MLPEVTSLLRQFKKLVKTSLSCSAYRSVKPCVVDELILGCLLQPPTTLGDWASRNVLSCSSHISSSVPGDIARSCCISTGSDPLEPVWTLSPPDNTWTLLSTLSLCSWFDVVEEVSHWSISAFSFAVSFLPKQIPTFRLYTDRPHMIKQYQMKVKLIARYWSKIPRYQWVG